MIQQLEQGLELCLRKQVSEKLQLVAQLFAVDAPRVHLGVISFRTDPPAILQIFR